MQKRYTQKELSFKLKYDYSFMGEGKCEVNREKEGESWKGSRMDRGKQKTMGKKEGKGQK